MFSRVKQHGSRKISFKEFEEALALIGMSYILLIFRLHRYYLVVVSLHFFVGALVCGLLKLQLQYFARVDMRMLFLVFAWLFVQALASSLSLTTSAHITTALIW